MRKTFRWDLHFFLQNYITTFCKGIEQKKLQIILINKIRNRICCISECTRHWLHLQSHIPRRAAGTSFGPLFSPPSHPLWRHFNHIRFSFDCIAQRFVEISAQRLKCTFVSSFCRSSDQRLHLYKISHCFFDVLRIFLSQHFYFILFVFFVSFFLVAPIEQKPRARSPWLMNFTTSVAFSRAQGSLGFVVLTALQKKNRRKVTKVLSRVVKL